MERLLNIDLLPKDLEKIASYLQPLTLKKGELFIEYGKRNNKIGIMQNGLMISTYISPKGKEEVSRIYSLINGNNIVSNHESFHYDKHSTENIIAIEETCLFVLTKEKLEKIIIQYPEVESIIKEVSEKSYINAIERIKEFQSYKAKERIEIHYNKYKELFSRVGKQQLSSFLGVNRNDFTKFLREINEN